MQLSYPTVKPLIKEADVLLFRAGQFPGAGWWIGKYTRSPYSHAGLAHWDDGKLYCLEFREFKGSRKYPMDKYMKEGVEIDVFRACSKFTQSEAQLVDDDWVDVVQNEYEFTEGVADLVTSTARSLLGRPYSYWTIWQIFKTYIPFIRLRTNTLKNGKVPKQFVCSTLVTYSYRVNFADPVPFLDDRYTSPGDLARSSIFHKIFEIRNDLRV
jgi:hypothetical protein